MASQMGKTDNVLNAIGQKIDDDPAPILYIGPTRSNVERVIEPRIMQMIRDCKTLWQTFSKGKSSSKNYKNINGVSIRLGWAGSATELASQDAAEVYVDERDRMDDDVGGEGDVIELADARHATYPEGRTVVTSTPTKGNIETETDEAGLERWAYTSPDDIESPTWKLWQEGTRYEWAWPCPDCGDYFIPRLKLLKWPENSTPRSVLKTAMLACPHCGSLIDNSKKDDMNARGVYVAPGQKIRKDGTIVGDVDENDTISFWVSGLCSPWKSFGQRAAAYLRAVRSGDPTRIQAVINTGFGELYRTGADSPDWQVVLDRRIDYIQGEVPNGVRYIFVTVDVQKDRLVYVVRGWGARMESWLIRAGELYGETEYETVYRELLKVMLGRFGDYGVNLTLIDSGYRPGDKHKRPVNQIYAFCRRNPALVRPIKGQQRQDKPIKATKIDVNDAGKTYKRGLQLWHLDTNFFKTFVYSRIEPPEGEPDLWHLPSDITEDYCKQVTAEAPVTKPSGEVVWVRNRKDNHFLDCEYMQVAAAYMMNVHLLSDVDEQRDSEDTSEQAKEAGDVYIENGVVRRRGQYRY